MALMLAQFHQKHLSLNKLFIKDFKEQFTVINSSKVSKKDRKHPLQQKEVKEQLLAMMLLNLIFLVYLIKQKYLKM